MESHISELNRNNYLLDVQINRENQNNALIRLPSHIYLLLNTQAWRNFATSRVISEKTPAYVMSMISKFAKYENMKLYCTG